MPGLEPALLEEEVRLGVALDGFSPATVRVWHGLPRLLGRGAGDVSPDAPSREGRLVRHRLLVVGEADGAVGLAVRPVSAALEHARDPAPGARRDGPRAARRRD